MLSAAFLDELGAQTLSFHLGSEISTIDLDSSNISWEAVYRVEGAVNQVVWEDRSVGVHIVGAEELDNIPLRKPPQVEGKVRVIWVEGYDASACGGTHVTRTGEIGLIKVISLVRYKGGVRVGFVCGARALQDYRRVLRITQDTSADLSVHQDELRDAVARLSEEARQTRRKLNHLRSEFMEHEAERLWHQTQEIDGQRRLSACYDERPFEEVRQLALRMREILEFNNVVCCT